MHSGAPRQDEFERVPAVGLRIGKTSDAVYRLLQRGELDGRCEAGRWCVSRRSVEKYLARQREASTAPGAA